MHPSTGINLNMNQGQQPHYHHQQQVSDEYDRKTRFTSGVDTPRSASQPPRTHGDNFLSSPLLANYGSTSPILGGMSGAPWARAPRMPSVPRSPSIGLPSSVPTRSSSFSVDRMHQNSFSAAMRESHSFASTFEDDESEAMSDTQQDFMSSRGRPQLSDMTRSRSQSLAAMRPAPMPIGTSVSQRGYSDMASSLHQAYSSGPLSIPNPSGVRYGEIKPPGAGSRYGSLGGMARSPMNVHASSPTGLRIGYGGDGISGRAEISNISPFVRDVGQIYDEYVWGNAAPPNDHGGLASGTTSRRHSVSIVQPRRGVVGFNAPGGGGAIGEDDLLSGSSANVVHNSGASLISDDDLAADLLNLNLGHSQTGNNNVNSSLPTSQPSSLPIYPPPHGYGAGVGTGLHSKQSPSPDKLQEAREELFAGVKVRKPRVPTTTERPISGGGGSGSGSSPLDLQSSHRVESTFTPAFGRPRPAQIQTGFDASMGARFNPGQGAHNITPGGQISPSLPRGAFPSAPAGGEIDPNAITPSNPFGMFGITPRKELPPNFLDTDFNPNPPPELPPDHWYLRFVKRMKTDDVRSMSDLGKGIPLHAIPRDCPLYIVEFKAGRTDLFFTRDNSMELHVGDLVIVEADRGRDLGKVVNDTISFTEVIEFQKQQQQNAPGGFGFGGDGGGHGGPTSPDTPTAAAAKKEKEISPKRILGRASPQDEQLLEAKTQDELKALQLCQSKVRQKKLPMEVLDAEYQWDRRKLTFYFIAEKRIDFRELVRELFRLYKTRIWMAALQGSAPVDQ